jgi:hypothetical protein
MIFSTKCASIYPGTHQGETSNVGVIVLTTSKRTSFETLIKEHQRNNRFQNVFDLGDNSRESKLNKLLPTKDK